jgi:hypothetical protein
MVRYWSDGKGGTVAMVNRLCKLWRLRVGTSLRCVRKSVWKVGKTEEQRKAWTD